MAHWGLCDWESDSPREWRAWGVKLGRGGEPWRLARKAERKGEGEGGVVTRVLVD